mmetsp:Transcript_37796/g.69441  ORF Transcript_37796/g.69441 Transcript_37796/m.69441 type:complete len:187 (+) Transcript_37796:175-735(+)
MLQSMTMVEREKLIVSVCYSSPYPFETEMKDDHVVNRGEEDVPHNAVICGALKEIGQTHLWERTRHLPEASDDKQHDECEEAVEHNIPEGRKEIFYGASAARASFHSQQLIRQQKRVLSRATKERLGRRAISMAAHKAEYSKVVKCSKVKWTEGDEKHWKESMESSTLTGRRVASSSIGTVRAATV